MRILVTGASGGLGRFLVQRIIDENGIGGGAPPFESLTLMARRTESLPKGPRIRVVSGDIRDPVARASALEGGADCVFHFAATLAAQAESEYDEGRAINVDASLALLNELRRQSKPPRVVYPSSIGIYGDALSRPIDDESLPRPNISYGAAKFINEILIADLTRRGDIDGVSLRLPACLPRPRQPDLTPSPDFASSVFHALAAGDRFQFPVSPNAAMWFLSVPGCMDSVLHAARLDSSAYGSRRALMLPALWLTTGQLVDGIVAELGLEAGSRVSWTPQPGVEERYAQFPALTTPFADSLGFRHDADLQTLVRRTFSVVARPKRND